MMSDPCIRAANLRTFNPECPWQASPLELTTEYELVGILIGLAIYNSHILEFRFPLVTYKKLLQLSPTLADLKGVSPGVYQSFQQLLTYDGDIKEHFDLTFQVGGGMSSR